MATLACRSGACAVLVAGGMCRDRKWHLYSYEERRARTSLNLRWWVKATRNVEAYFLQKGSYVVPMIYNVITPHTR